MSLSSILVINETSFALGNLFSSLSLGLSQLGHDVSDIAALYSRIDAYEAQQATQQHLLPYPLPGSHILPGMDIKFSNVSFRYPGAPQGQFALRNVSFTIERSSMVVIVGQNGSGKSSLANLLTGLTKPVSGDILIDDIKSSSFRRADLAQAIASLTQDHRILPLSIAENISLGDPSHTQCMGRIREAAELGGAAGFIDKFPDGLDHSLAVLRTHYTHGDLPEGPLADFAEEFTRYTDISGGERQRLAAARTFMRLLSSKTKLVVADEPSAAIDPIGEHELFERLREYRRGKTMVFISHRFGHLTKYADQILCMKDGQLVEAGTHAQLMALEGEYRRLYDVQARAFTEDIPPSPDI
ncbi:P-loop containing nucleoside triphosphate hydrolase protein [Irpex lacteus]|nr:P-loop containing nucleoside triphosphate hydrolase protein [Irpex lacteus]